MNKGNEHMVVCPKCRSQKVAQILYGCSIYETLKYDSARLWVLGLWLSMGERTTPSYKNYENPI